MSRSVERLVELSGACAAQAAEALGRMLDRAFDARPPRCWKLNPGEAPSELFPAQDRVAGVFTDFEGILGGQAGLLLSEDGALELLDQLLDAPDKLAPELDPRERSALQVVGNIVISAAASALARLEGGVVIPSVPRLRYLRAGGLSLEDGCVDLDKLPEYVLETEIIERDGSLHLRFLWMPR
jgi:chemotaxis protein CheY-P-specific phosphatase CheC